MTERAEGFWWVRWRKHDPVTGAQAGELERWEVAEVAACDWEAFGLAYSTARSVRTSRGTAMSSSTLLEWGPYLGKEPVPVDVDAFIAEHAAEVARAFDAFKPRFDVKPDAVYKGAESWEPHSNAFDTLGMFVGDTVDERAASAVEEWREAVARTQREPDGAIAALVEAARTVLLDIDARHSESAPHSSLDPAPELRAALAAFETTRVEVAVADPWIILEGEKPDPVEPPRFIPYSDV